jgi:uncharacterized membrane protein
MSKYIIELWHTDSPPHSMVVEHTEHPYPVWYGDHAIIKYAGGLMTIATTFITAIVINEAVEDGGKNEVSFSENQLFGFDAKGLLNTYADSSNTLSGALWQWDSLPLYLREHINKHLSLAKNITSALIVRDVIDFNVPLDKMLFAGWNVPNAPNFLKLLSPYVSEHVLLNFCQEVSQSVTGRSAVLIYGSNVIVVWCS